MRPSIGEGCAVLHDRLMRDLNIPLLECDALLRKELFRLLAEVSTERLVIDDDVLGHHVPSYPI